MRTIDPGILTEVNERLAATGYVISPEPDIHDIEPYGFMIRRETQDASGRPLVTHFNYRFREGETATDLLKRILVELGG